MEETETMLRRRLGIGETGWGWYGGQSSQNGGQRQDQEQGVDAVQEASETR